MKKQTLVLSLGYWFSSYTLGLLLHPYKTVRGLVRLGKLPGLVIVPLVTWVFAWVMGMVGLRFGWVLLWLLGLQATSRFVNILVFLWWWLTAFLVLWQVVVGYLYVRFRLTLRN